MSKTFTEQLQRLANNPNLGRGFITLASADLLRAQKQATLDTLTNLNKAVNLTNQDIATTEQQLKQLQANPEGTDALANISESAAQYEQTIRSLITRKKKFGETFNKTMMALSVIGGKDAQLAGSVVEQRKTDLLKNIDELVALPDKTLRQKVLQTNLLWSQEKYRTVMDNKERLNQVRQVEGAIINDASFSNIHGGDYNTYSPAEQQKLDKNIAKIIKDRQSEFGGKLMDNGVIADAFKLALEDTKKNFTFKQYIDKTQIANDKATQAAVASGLASLKGWSARYAGIDKSVKNALGDMMIKAQNPNGDEALSIRNDDGSLMSDAEILAKNGVDTKKYDMGIMHELYNIYKPGGDYLQTFAYLAQYIPEFNIGEDYNKWLGDNFIDYTSDLGNNNQLHYRIAKNQKYRDFIIPTGEFAFAYPDGRWQAGDNLKWIERQFRQLAPDNTTFGVPHEFMNGVYDSMFGSNIQLNKKYSNPTGANLPLPTKENPRGQIVPGTSKKGNK